VWREDPVFYYKSFPERWALVHQFFRALAHDPVLQRRRLRAATYELPLAVSSPTAESVVEWVPFAPNQRRLIMVPTTHGPTTHGPTTHGPTTHGPTTHGPATHGPTTQSPVKNRVVQSTSAPTVAPAAPTAPVAPVAPDAPDATTVARKDPAGPDVYSLWRGTTALGQALVRTLAVSKAMRMYKGDSIPVSVSFHKGFSKWEVVGVQ
jgi:hypothetical protein